MTFQANPDPDGPNKNKIENSSLVLWIIWLVYLSFCPPDCYKINKNLMSFYFERWLIKNLAREVLEIPNECVLN